MPSFLMKNVVIEQIVIGVRTRKDFGDIDELTESIKKLGLLQPICVQYLDGEYWLVDGHRRLFACQKLGYKDIPAILLNTNEGVHDNALQAEYDANIVRKQFTPSEAVELAGKIKKQIENNAKMRQIMGGKGDAVSSAKLAQDKDKGKKTRDVVANTVGMSHETLKKAKEVVNAAKENPDHNDLVEKMDQTGKVDPVYKELQERREEINVTDQHIKDAEEFYDSEYDKMKQNIPKGKMSLPKELENIAKKTGSTISSLIVKMPDGRQKKMGSISNDWYQNKNILDWIIENIGLGIEEKDIVIHREGNQVFVFDSDHVDNLRKSIRYLVDRYSFTGSLMRELTEEEKECTNGSPMTL